MRLTVAVTSSRALPPDEAVYHGYSCRRRTGWGRGLSAGLSCYYKAVTLHTRRPSASVCETWTKNYP